MLNMIPYRSHRMPSLFDDRMFRFFDFGNNGGGFHVDVRDAGDHYMMEAELPGMKQENIDLSVNDDVLTVAARREDEHRDERENYLYMERRSGSFQRSFTLEGVDHDNIEAVYKDGILSVRLPKLAPEPQKTERKIPIQ